MHEIFAKLGFTTKHQGSWIWIQFTSWKNWWLGISFKSKAAAFADVDGRWFFLPLYGGKTVTVTLPNGKKAKAVNRQGYPQPYAVQTWDKQNQCIGMVVLTLTNDGRIVVTSSKRAHGVTVESPRASKDNPEQPSLTRAIKLGTNHLDPARITGEGGHKPNVTIYAKVDIERDEYTFITVEEAWALDDVGTTAALGLLAHKVGSLSPTKWVKWLKKQERELLKKEVKAS